MTKLNRLSLSPAKRLEKLMPIWSWSASASSPRRIFSMGVELSTSDGGVIVDEHLRAADDLYAAGDIALFPSSLTGERQRIEHWRTALQQGRIAARNMAGKNSPI